MVDTDRIWPRPMAEGTQKRILRALLVALRPIAKSLLQSGIGYREFVEVAKLAFVQIATEDYGIRGRPTNVSRVSLITGVSRKEVGKIRSSQENGQDLEVKGTPAGEVLHRWHTDPKYRDSKGNILALHMEKGDETFRSLVKDVVGDVPPGAMKAELARVSAILEDDDGWMTVKKRHFVPARVDDRLLHGFDTAIAYLADTVAYNSNPNRKSVARFERVISSVNISPDKFQAVQTETQQMLESFSVQYDDFLSSKESPGALSGAEGEIGVGVYFFRKVN